MSRRLAACLAGLALVGALPAAAQQEPLSASPEAPPEAAAEGAVPPRVVAVEPVFVLRGDEAVPLDAEPPHPGEVIGLRLAAAAGEEGESGPGFQLVAPGASLGDVTPLRLVAGDPRADGADVIEVLLLALGEATIPAITLRAADGSTLATEPVDLEVVPLLDESDEEAAPSRGQVGIGLNWWGVALVAVVLLAPLVGLIVYLLRRRRRGPAAGPKVPAAPEPEPEVWAHAELDRLLASNLLAEGRMKEFHVRLAEISKGYLSRRYHLHLMEKTTAECPDELRAAGVARELAREVGGWLAEIDLVKFAGERPPGTQVVASAQALRNMIERTTPHHSAEEIVAATEATEG